MLRVLVVLDLEAESYIQHAMLTVSEEGQSCIPCEGYTCQDAEGFLACSSLALDKIHHVSGRISVLCAVAPWAWLAGDPFFLVGRCIFRMQGVWLVF